MTDLPIQRLLLEAIAVVDRLGIPYMIMGGFAVRLWAIPRPTYDADLAVDATDEQLARLLGALAEAGFDVPEEHRKDFRDVVGGMQKVKVTRFAGGSVWEVDLFVVQEGLLHSALGRRRFCRLEDRPVAVMAPEDVILLKLSADRRKDRLDVEEILKVTSDLDRPYLLDWSSRLGLRERLAEFLP